MPINGTGPHKHKNHQNQRTISATNDYYRQHGVSTHLALLSIIRLTQVLIDSDCGKQWTTQSGLKGIFPSVQLIEYKDHKSWNQQYHRLVIAITLDHCHQDHNEQEHATISDGLPVQFLPESQIWIASIAWTTGHHINRKPEAQTVRLQIAKSHNPLFKPTTAERDSTAGVWWCRESKVYISTGLGWKEARPVGERQLCHEGGKAEEVDNSGGKGKVEAMCL
jgi:hypothetical protein